MACFADINVSQGSVATYARCGEIFDVHLTANLPRKESASEKNISNPLIKLQNYGHEFEAPFLAHPVHLP